MESVGQRVHPKGEAESRPGGEDAAADARLLSGLKAGAAVLSEEVVTRHEEMVYNLTRGLLEDRGKGDVLRSWISTLPPMERAVFVLRDQEELSCKQVAKVLGRDEAAGRSSLHRARLYLRERAKRHIYSGR